MSTKNTSVPRIIVSPCQSKTHSLSFLLLIGSLSGFVLVDSMHGSPGPSTDWSLPVPLSQIQRVALWQAERLWGQARPGAPVPCYDSSGELTVYLCPFRIGNQSFPSSESILRGVQEARRWKHQIELENSERLGDGFNRESQPNRTDDPMLQESMKMARYSELGIGEYGAVFVSARYDRYPIVMVCNYLPPYYTKVDLAGDKAKHKTGKKTADLKRYYFLGPRGQAFKMDCEGHEVLLHAYTLQEMDKQEFAIQPPRSVKSEYNTAWDAFRDTISPPDFIYLGKKIQNWEIMPCVEWCRGCTPTSASMVLGYYDRGGLGAESLGLGRLIDHWQMLSEYTDGRTGLMVNVPNVLDELRQDMLTNSEGSTGDMNIAMGIMHTCNDRNGYAFRAERIDCDEQVNQWCWDTITDEINHNRPFIWSSWPFGGGIGHSVSAFGYRYNQDIEQDRYVMTYNTWECPGQDDWHYKKYDNGADLEYAQVDRVLPGGWTWGQTSLYVPNGGEVWGIGTTQDIWWYEDDARTCSAELEYSTDGGVTWTAFATVQPSSPGWHKYSWTIPNEPTQQARVRIRNFSGSEGQWVLQASDGSEDNFTMTHPYFLLAPQNEPVWYVGQRVEIRWTEYGTGDFVRLERSSDNGQTWTLLAARTPNDRQYDYVVTEPVSTQCRIRISAVDRPDIVDSSDAFEVRKPFLTLNAPSAGAILYPQFDYDIRWSSGGVSDAVHIELSRNGGSTWEMLAANTENDGYYRWKATAPASDQCRIRIRSVDNPSLTSKSLFNFSIREPSIRIVQPAAGQTLFLEQDFEILWTTAGVTGDVRIEKSTDGGALWAELAVTANDGSHLWHVEGPASTTCMIRVSSLSDPAVFGTTGVFEIRRALHILYPFSGESCYIGDRDAIRWIPGGVGEHVRIKIKQDSETDWQTLVANTPNDGQYEWNIVEDPGLYQIEIVSAEDPKYRQTSESFIVERWELLSPNGQEVWNRGETYPIRWRGHKSTKEVMIEFLHNGWNRLTEPVPCSGEFLWTLPSYLSGQNRIRITLQDSTGLCVDESDSDFTVFAPSIRVFKPGAGGVVFVGDACRIVWDSQGAGRTVSIELVRQSLLSGWQEIVSRTANDGEYVWKVTGPASALSAIRIHSCDIPELYSPSTGYFTIAERPHIELSYPNGGQMLYEGQACNLTWSSYSAGDRVQIELSRDDGETWSSIVDSTENDGLYAWVVEGPGTPTARIRVTSVENPSLFDASDDAVDIVPFTMVIFSTGSGYDPHSGEFVTGPQNILFPGKDYDAAIKFITNGYDYQISLIRVPAKTTIMSWYNVLDISLMDDDGGKPGRILATTSAAVPILDPDWVTFPLRYRITKNTPYWIMFSVTRNGYVAMNYVYPYSTMLKTGRVNLGEWSTPGFSYSIAISIEGTPRVTLPDFPEVFPDKAVDIRDVVALSESWLESDCEDMTNRYCNHADLDHSGKVDMKDWLLLARQWMALLPED